MFDSTLCLLAYLPLGNGQELYPAKLKLNDLSVLLFLELLSICGVFSAFI